MSSLNSQKIIQKQELKIEEDDEYNIKIFRRTLENYTHEVIEDTKIKKVTSWRKSQKKFFQSLILNIFTLGILHIISLFYPNLYIKLYCNRRKPKECDFFLVEDIYGNLTLCKKIFKKDKTQNIINFSTDNTKDAIISSSLTNFNTQLRKSLTKNLTYSFKYKSITYEYDEITNQITPVYMNLSNLTCKDIFHYFSDGLSSEVIVKIFEKRYGKNEYELNFNLVNLFFHRIELPNFIIVLIIGLIDFILSDFISFIAKIIIIVILLIGEYIHMKLTIYSPYKRECTLDGDYLFTYVPVSPKIGLILAKSRYFYTAEIIEATKIRLGEKYSGKPDPYLSVVLEDTKLIFSGKAKEGKVTLSIIKLAKDEISTLNSVIYEDGNNILFSNEASLNDAKRGNEARKVSISF